jgi:CheY-like chemotaxis protein
MKNKILTLKKVLVVDDEPAIRFVLAEALRGFGYEPIEAATAKQALDLFAGLQPGIVLLDINLPDSSGLDLLRKIKTSSPLTNVIMVTGDAVFENAVSALRGGAGDFICKPINLKELRVALEKLSAVDHQEVDPTGAYRPKVLIVTDSEERCCGWERVFHPNEADIRCVIFPEEWCYVGQERHDLAIIDVCSILLEAALKNLRAKKEFSEIPVLVEIGRADKTIGKGVLPMYRAMPCNDEEMLRLVRRRITTVADVEHRRSLL